jgi:hypothetical protein
MLAKIVGSRPELILFRADSQGAFVFDTDSAVNTLVMPLEIIQSTEAQCPVTFWHRAFEGSLMPRNVFPEDFSK